MQHAMEFFLAKLMEAMIIVGTMLCPTKTKKNKKFTKKFHGFIFKNMFESFFKHGRVQHNCSKWSWGWESQIKLVNFLPECVGCDVRGWSGVASQRTRSLIKVFETSYIVGDVTIVFFERFT
jgi:hypothetical protein